MPYGTIKVDNITFTDNSVDKTVSLSGLIQNPTFTGNVTVTGTISGDVIRGGTTISGVTVTGTTANFASGVFTTQVSGTFITGATVTATTGNFTSLTGTTTTGTTANFASGVFTTQVSGVTVIATTGTFTSLTGTTTTGTTANFASGVFTTQVSGATITGTTANFTSGNFISLSGTTTTVTSGVFSAGSATAPSVAVGTGTTYKPGIYSPGADQLAISTNGTGRLFVDATGNIGVGTSSPANFTGFVTLALADSSGAEVDFIKGSTVQGSVYNASDIFYIESKSTVPTAFVTNGSERMRLTSAGLLGLGTSSPGYTLDVSGTARTTGILFNSDDSILSTQGTISKHSTVGLVQRGVTASVFDWAVYSAANTAIIVNPTGTNKVSFSGGEVYFTGGNVGIGNTSPEALLDVSLVRSSATHSTAIFSTTGTGVASDINRILIKNVNTASGRNFGVGVGGVLTATASNQASLAFYYDNGNATTEGARIDSSGRLLVGTSAARQFTLGSTGFEAQNLFSGSSIFTASTLLTRDSNDNAGYNLYLGKTRATSIGSYTNVVQNDELGQITFGGANQGAFSPGAQITAFVDGEPSTASDTTDMPGRLVFSTTADGAASPTEQMRIDSLGNVLIGATVVFAPCDGLLSVTKNSASTASPTIGVINPSATAAYVSFSDSAVVYGSITRLASATVYNTTSDYRLKTVIGAVSNAGQRIDSLRPVEYTWNADGSRSRGFLAHEFQEVYAGSVSGTKDAVDDKGNPIYQAMQASTSEVIADLVAEIQCLRARVAALETA